MKIASVLVMSIFWGAYAQGSELLKPEQAPINQAAVSLNSFEECTAVSLWQYSGRSLNGAVKDGKPIDSTVKIPKGWSVIGTGISVQNSDPILFICH